MGEVFQAKEVAKEATIKVTSHGDEANYFEPIAAYCSSSNKTEFNFPWG